MSNLIEIPARLEQHRRDGVTCEQIAGVKPWSWKRELRKGFLEALVGVGVGVLIARLLVMWFDSSLDKLLR